VLTPLLMVPALSLHRAASSRQLAHVATAQQPHLPQMGQLLLSWRPQAGLAPASNPRVRSMAAGQRSSGSSSSICMARAALWTCGAQEAMLPQQLVRRQAGR
jgi:hypothetical protein